MSVGIQSEQAVPTNFNPLATPQLLQAVISFNTTGDNTVVAGSAGNRVRAYKIVFNVGGATNVTVKDGSLAVSGAMNLAANQGMALGFDGEPWWYTSQGNAFVINQSGSVQVSGTLWYTLQP